MYSNSSAAMTPQPAQGKSKSGAGEAAGHCVSSAELLRGQKTVAISHNGLTYWLQATRLGKLILTK
jgi:hemin uptake protein HemP